METYLEDLLYPETPLQKVTKYTLKFVIKNLWLVFIKPLMAFNGVTNTHGASPQPTACRPPTCSQTTATGSNQT